MQALLVLQAAKCGRNRTLVFTPPRATSPIGWLASLTMNRDTFCGPIAF